MLLYHPLNKHNFKCNKRLIYLSSNTQNLYWRWSLPIRIFHRHLLIFTFPPSISRPCRWEVFVERIRLKVANLTVLSWLEAARLVQVEMRVVWIWQRLGDERSLWWTAGAAIFHKTHCHGGRYIKLKIIYIKLNIPLWCIHNSLLFFCRISTLINDTN